MPLFSKYSTICAAHPSLSVFFPATARDELVAEAFMAGAKDPDSLENFKSLLAAALSATSSRTSSPASVRSVSTEESFADESDSLYQDDGSAERLTPRRFRHTRSSRPSLKAALASDTEAETSSDEGELQSTSRFFQNSRTPSRLGFFQESSSLGETFDEIISLGIVLQKALAKLKTDGAVSLDQSRVESLETLLKESFFEKADRFFSDDQLKKLIANKLSSLDDSELSTEEVKKSSVRMLVLFVSLPKDELDFFAGSSMVERFSCLIEKQEDKFFKELIEILDPHIAESTQTASRGCTP